MPQDPLHGITLANLLAKLVDTYGWNELGKRIPIKCFTNDPSISSSLKFLRKTPWARVKVEQLYVNTLSAEQSGANRGEAYLIQNGGP
jgi:uncharacterized protein (DUF2132 family)